jgi:hypothetical protein
MKRLRIRIIVLASWLIVFSSLSRLLGPVGINNLSLGLGWVMVIVVLGLPRMARGAVWVIMLVLVTTLLLTKFWARGLSSDLALFVTVLEVCALVVTTLVTRWVNLALNEFEKTVVNLTLGQRERVPETALSGQGTIYREVRRARNHDHPLALISISVDEKSIDPKVEAVVREIQASMMKQYKLQGLSNMLCAELEDCAVIVEDTDHYLAVLPDTLPEELPVVVKRLRQKACDELGVEIKIGVATLPKDGYTFDGLVETATREMANDREPPPCLVLEAYPLESRIRE